MNSEHSVQFKEALSSSKIINDVLYQLSRAKRIYSADKEMMAFLNSLDEIAIRYCESYVEPPFTKTAKALGLGTKAFRKKLEQIHQALMSQENYKTVLAMQLGTVEFRLHGWQGFTCFLIDGLGSIPRKGERVKIPHFEGQTGSVLFYVDQVYHDIDRDRCTTRVVLKHDTSKTE